MMMIDGISRPYIQDFRTYFTGLDFANHYGRMRRKKPSRMSMARLNKIMNHRVWHYAKYKIIGK